MMIHDLPRSVAFLNDILLTYCTVLKQSLVSTSSSASKTRSLPKVIKYQDWKASLVALSPESLPYFQISRTSLMIWYFSCTHNLSWRIKWESLADVLQMDTKILCMWLLLWTFPLKSFSGATCMLTSEILNKPSENGNSLNQTSQRRIILYIRVHSPWGAPPVAWLIVAGITNCTLLWDPKMYNASGC